MVLGDHLVDYGVGCSLKRTLTTLSTNLMAKDVVAFSIDSVRAISTLESVAVPSASNGPVLMPLVAKFTELARRPTVYVWIAPVGT